MDKCNKCGVCCKIFHINLTKEEYGSKKYKTVFESIEHVNDFLEAEMIGANIVAKNEDESCIYLKNGICQIHENRPQSCRNFFCNSKKEEFKEMIKEIEEYKSGLNQ